MIIEFALIALGMGLFSVLALMWPLWVKPALRRRYEREYHRRKARGG